MTLRIRIHVQGEVVDELRLFMEVLDRGGNPPHVDVIPLMENRHRPVPVNGRWPWLAACMVSRCTVLVDERGKRSLPAR